MFAAGDSSGIEVVLQYQLFVFKIIKDLINKIIKHNDSYVRHLNVGLWNCLAQPMLNKK